jgi:hypothetical protein
MISTSHGHRTALAAAFLLAACGSGGSRSTITVSPPEATLAPMAQQAFAAALTGAPSVSWTVKEGDAGGTISSAGLYTAPAATGRFTVVAVEPTSGARGEASVTVTTNPPPPVGGPPANFTIPEAHPRLWWTASRLAQAQAWLAAHPFTPASDDYFHIAWKHAVAGTDCSPAIAWAASFQVPSGQWSPSANGSDEARWGGERAFLVYDWCYDQWTAQQRSDFLDNIGGSGHGWNDYLAGIDQQAWGGLYEGEWMNQSNYNWGNLRNDIDFGIATYYENQTAAPGFLDYGLETRWWDNFVPSTTGDAAGGVGQEGTAYGSAVIPPMFPFVTIANGGRDILNETGWFKQFVYYLIYSTTPAPTYHARSGVTAYQLSPFNDDEIFADGGILNKRTYYQDFMKFASNYWSAVNVGKHARHWVNTVGAHSATLATSRYVDAQDSAPAAASYGSLPHDYYASGAQYLYGRKAWDSSSTYFHWQLGESRSGVGHTHQDVGNFHLWRGGRWLTRESTGYSNTITGYAGTDTLDQASESAIAHNVPVFHAALATWGPRLPSRTAGHAVVRRLESRTGYAYADVDLTNRYLWDSGHSHLSTGAAVHVGRELLFLRNLETTVILDRLTTGNVTNSDSADYGTTAANEGTTFLIHFETNPTLEDATHLTATNGTQALRMTTLVPSNPTRRVVNEQSCSGCSAGIGQYRVEIDATGAAQRYFLHVLQARDAGGANITASVVDSAPGNPTTGTFTVTLHPSAGADTIIVFNKGQTSSGGTVNLAGAGATALAGGVQGIGYTDAGPVWSEN